ncbi:MAG: type II secretion system protein [Sedimentisphaerales bacterium]|nr:type II secretion system protein [Sedimentisphaerales bacterium]
MSGINKKYKGVFLVELIVSLTVLGILLACLGISLYGFAKFNLYQLVRQQCIAAGQAQLDSITATGHQVSQDDIKRLWPKIDVTIEQSEGTGQWAGLKLVRAKSKGMSFSTPVNVELSRYIAIPITQQEQ